jgi:hypothetical protein
MIPPDVWIKNVRAVVGFISDEQAQRDEWLVSEPSIIWWPDELFCKFFDDLFFDEFLLSPEINLTSEQRAAGETLLAKMEIFSDSTPVHVDPKHIIDDDRWVDIRRAAQVFLDGLCPR